MLIFVLAKANQKREIVIREENLKSKMRQLYDDIITGQYHITPPTRHIITDPVPRELLVLHFRDRIVQHLVHSMIAPIRDRWFIYDSYSNRISKGTLRAIQRAIHFMRAVSDCYTQDAYVMKLDIQSFFVSVEREILWRLVAEKVDHYLADDKQGLGHLLYQIIFYDYIGQCRDCTTWEERSIFPLHKSLCSVPITKGMPLGNLTSQLFANIYLHHLDQFIKHKLHAKYYIRYVDDFVLFARSKDELLDGKSDIEHFLIERLCLTLHPDKMYLQHITKGVRFLGIDIYPWHRVVKAATIKKCIQKITDAQTTEEGRYRSMMSYCGLAQHHDMYHFSRQSAYCFLSSL